jgi:hypothetical protein
LISFGGIQTLTYLDALVLPIINYEIIQLRPGPAR